MHAHIHTEEEMLLPFSHITRTNKQRHHAIDDRRVDIILQGTKINYDSAEMLLCFNQAHELQNHSGEANSLPKIYWPSIYGCLIKQRNVDWQIKP